MKSRLPLWCLTLLMLAAALLPGSLWAQGNFVYTNDDHPFSNTVSAFAVDSNGTLTAVAGSPFATHGSGGGAFFASNRIGVAIVDKLLFASNALSNDVSVFTINPSTGILTLVSGSPFATGLSCGFPPFGIAVSPTSDGRFLMATNNDCNKITVFSIGHNGALTPIAGSPFPTLPPGVPDGIKLSSDGKFLAVAKINFGGQFNYVEMFSVASDGSLTSLGNFAGDRLAGVDIDCSTRFLYGSEGIDAFRIASNGTLTPVPGSPFTPRGGNSTSNVLLLSPDDKTLFVSNQNSNTITAFNVASNGSLSLLAGSPFSMNRPVVTPSGMATSEDGTLLYVADYNPAVSVFRVASNGALTEVVGSPFYTRRDPGLMSLTAFPPKACELAVGIEIKPAAPPPVPVNPGAKGKIPVAILSTLSFNAVTEVNTSSLTFGHTGNEASLAFCGPGGEDVNDDGLVDLVCHFNTAKTGFVAGDTTAFLKGKTFSGRKLQGSEGIRTVPR